MYGCLIPFTPKFVLSSSQRFSFRCLFLSKSFYWLSAGRRKGESGDYAMIYLAPETKNQKEMQGNEMKPSKTLDIVTQKRKWQWWWAPNETMVMPPYAPRPVFECNSMRSFCMCVPVWVKDQECAVGNSRAGCHENAWNWKGRKIAMPTEKWVGVLFQSAWRKAATAFLSIHLICSDPHGHCFYYRK